MNKKIFYLVVAVLLIVFFTACEGKEDKNADIVGLWTFVDGIYDIENPQNPALAEEMKRIGKEALDSLSQGEYSIEFMANKTCIIRILSETTTSTYSQNGNSVSITAFDEKPKDIELTTYVTIQNGILTISEIINLDSAIIKGQETWREMGFTKYEIKVNFKKVSK